MPNLKFFEKEGLIKSSFFGLPMLINLALQNGMSGKNEKTLVV